MLKKIGRLDISAQKELVESVGQIFNYWDKGNAEKGDKLLYEFAKSPNYFVREALGKILLEYRDQARVEDIARTMLEDKTYFIRATGLFYFYFKHFTEPEKIIGVLDATYDSVPWETESILFEMWKRYPNVMKREMMHWAESDNERKRALSFHGMENLAPRDPVYVMEFINRTIDDPSEEVQKKITHILTQVARSRPAEAYPYVREWLSTGDEQRMKTLWVSMKKLANIVVQKSKREKSQEFIMLTHRTIADWRHDDNRNVATMGSKLTGILKNRNNANNHDEDDED
jgi:3-methyladenine DNA glycosylase AlkC